MQKKAEGLSPQTIYIYRCMLEIFFRSVHKSPEYITANDIRDFLMDYQNHNKISNRTLDKYRGYICCYFTYLHDYGYISMNISKQVNPIKYEIKHKDILTPYEEELLREACKSRRESAMIEFLISTACRIGELVKVKLSDINWDNCTVLFHGKGNKQRIEFFNARCKISLIRYIEERETYGGEPRHRSQPGDGMKCEYLFIYDRAPYMELASRAAEKIVRNIVSRVEEISSTKYITAHRFRATTATACYEKGMSVYDISRLLGHKSVDTTINSYIQGSTEHVYAEYNRFMN